MFGEHEHNPSSPCFVRKENLILLCLQSVLAVSGAALSNSALLQTAKMNVNQYATKKTIAQGMLDIALLTANASQLKFVLEVSPNQTKEVLADLIIWSKDLQYAVLFCQGWERDPQPVHRHARPHHPQPAAAGQQNS